MSDEEFRYFNRLREPPKPLFIERFCPKHPYNAAAEMIEFFSNGKEHCLECQVQRWIGKKS